MKLNPQELAAVLCGLRMVQARIIEGGPDAVSGLIHFNDFPPPTSEDLDALCERLNTEPTDPDPDKANAVLLGIIRPDLVANPEPYDRRAITPDGFAPVSFVHLDDLAGRGFDITAVSESDLVGIARDMDRGLMEAAYWDALDAAADANGVPRKEVEG